MIDIFKIKANYWAGLIILLSINACKHSNALKEKSTNPNQATFSEAHQDSIIKKYLEEGAWRYGLYSRERQEEIDKGLAQDSTIAYLWQQKAMPLYKQGKYELGKRYIDKAVKFDRVGEWQEYRAFMSCIFSKRYQEAIVDFEACKEKQGNSYVMDHSYDFYIGLSYLQLNQFAKAEERLRQEVDHQYEEYGEEMVHHLDLFYLGIAQYEQGKYKDALTTFDRALAKYPKFSDVLYHKAICLGKMGGKTEAKETLEAAKEYGKLGYTINEDNSLYERYPYQVRWELWD